MTSSNDARPTVTEADVISALSKVNDPELNRDLVTLGMIRDVAIDGAHVTFTVVLTTPACPLKNKIQQDCEQAVGAIAGVERVTVNWDAQVRQDKRISEQIDIGVKNAIAVASGKGGVGKSTVSVNLAAALAAQGATVGLLDADVYGPNVPIMMGVAHRRPESSDGKRMLPIEAFGVRMMSIGFLLEADRPVVWRGPLIHGALRQFLQDVEWGEPDYLIVDLPPGTGDAQLSLTQTIPLTGAVIVTTPQAVALADVAKSIAMFRLEQIDVPVLGLVENMSSFIAPDTGNRYDIFGSGGGAALAERMHVEFLGDVPIDPTVREAGDAGIPIVVSHPDSVAARALTQIALKIAGKVSVINSERGSTRGFQADPELRIVK